jgi:hypothetical protein
MCCCGTNDRDCCHGIVAVIGPLPLLLTAGLVVGLIVLVARIAGSVSLPPAAWIPLSIAAFAGIAWGLWIGYKLHGRGEPLTVGMLGLVVAAAGFAFDSFFAIVGVLIALGAALWSTMAHAERAQR